MPVTAKFSLPYPDLDDAPNAPAQIQALAQAVDSLHLPKAMACGTLTLTCSAANVSDSAAVTFPAGTFTTTPIVLVTLGGGVSGTVTAFVWPATVTASGFTAWLNRSTTTATAVNWLAIQS